MDKKAPLIDRGGSSRELLDLFIILHLCLFVTFSLYPPLLFSFPFSFFISRLTSATYLTNLATGPALAFGVVELFLFWVSGNEYNEWDRGEFCAIFSRSDPWL